MIECTWTLQKTDSSLDDTALALKFPKRRNSTSNNRPAHRDHFLQAKAPVQWRASCALLRYRNIKFHFHVGSRPSVLWVVGTWNFPTPSVFVIGVLGRYSSSAQTHRRRFMENIRKGTFTA